jgi:formamidopyrimidine-DNA glycosylase
MPELPEVETIRRQLSTHLPLEIENVSYSKVSESILKKKDRGFDPKGKTITEIKRKGKLMDFVLSGEHHILSHLGMSGSWRVWQKREDVPHSHIILEGKNSKGPLVFAYVDPRRFGNMYFVDQGKAQFHLQKLGVDIGSADFTPEYIHQACQRYPERQIKAFLLDQAFFAGCGNYIACEICARAGIRPTRKCQKITRDDAAKIKAATISVLEGQIESNGLTFQGGYTDTSGEKGEGLSQLVVFHQVTCGLCKKGKVKKIVLAQRGTYYCPRCQK